jgi:hypothetical protein
MRIFLKREVRIWQAYSVQTKRDSYMHSVLLLENKYNRDIIMFKDITLLICSEVISLKFE